MRVQACPSCGARYNVTHLDEGDTFQCRRCSAPVTVGGTLAPRRTTSAALWVAGFLMILALFLRSNPWFGDNLEWPWDTFERSGSDLRKTTAVVWALAGLWALLTALTPSGRSRGSVAIVASAVLAVLCTNEFAGFDVRTMRLPQLLGAMALGAGLLLFARPASLRVARALAFLGGAVLVLWHATHFAEGSDESAIVTLWSDLRALVGGGAYSNPNPQYAWTLLVPEWMAIAAGAMGILAAVGVRWRAWCVSAFLVLLVSLALPTAVDFTKGTESAVTLTVVASRTVEALVQDGVALFLLGAAAALDLARASETPQ